MEKRIRYLTTDEKMTENIQKRIKQLIRAIGEGIWEKERILAMGVLCGISEESLFLLGPPGTGKSMVARRLKEIFAGGTSFEYLMSRFSTPDEIFGPVSIRKLKDEDCYERSTDGYLPAADVVFLDEIWKAGPAIQNALLTAINERIFQNGAVTMRLPMKVLIAASNELPREDEGLEALWDRFLVRMVSNGIESEATFYKMLRQQETPVPDISPTLRITDEELSSWRKEIRRTELPEQILKVITRVRNELKVLSKGENVEPLDYYISDRRWKKTAGLLQTSAFLNGRSSVDHSDLVLLLHILWNKTECMVPVTEAVIRCLFADIQAEIDTMVKELETTDKADDRQPTSFKIYSYFYAKLLPLDKGRESTAMFIVLNDYGQLSLTVESNGIRYHDASLDGDIIRTFSSTSTPPGEMTRVRLRRGKDSVFIDGKEYLLEKSGDTGTSINTLINRQCLPDLSRLHLEDRVFSIRNSFNSRKEILVDNNTNIFVSGTDIRLLRKYALNMEKTVNALEVRVKSANPHGI